MKLLALILSACLLTVSLYSQNYTNNTERKLTTADNVLDYHQNPYSILKKDSFLNEGISNQNYITVKNKYRLNNIVGSLDSIVEYSDNYFVNRYLYEYDSYGNLVSEKQFDRDYDTVPWSPLIYNLSTYNLNQNISSKIFHQWDYNENNWRNMSKAVLLYDSLQRRTNQLNYQWNSSTTLWYLAGQTAYSYDSNDILDTIYNDRYNSNGEWEHISRDVYNVDSLLRQYEFSKYINNNWELNYKVDYKYDSIGNPLKTFVLSLNSDSSTLDSSRIYTYTFDSLSQMRSSDEYWWDTTFANNWSYNKRYLYDYNINGKLISKIKYLNFCFQGFEEFEKSVSTYDSYGNNLTYTDFFRLYNTLDTVYSNCNYYNYSFNNADLSLPSETSSPNMLTGLKTDFWQHLNPGNYKDAERRTVYYYSNTVGFKENKQLVKACKVYPNPTSDFIYFDIKLEKILSIELFDITGKKVISTFGNQNNKLNVRGLEKGVYLYRVSTPDNVYSNKIIIQ